MGGGFDAINDLSQVFRFAIRDNSGFDPEAVRYWCNHQMQANKVQKGMGLVHYSEDSEFPDRYDIWSLHLEVAGPAFADEFNDHRGQLLTRVALSSLGDSAVGMTPCGTST